MTRAMVVLSGGQDSTTSLYWAKHRYDELFAVSFDYGQRHSIELEAAKQIAKLAGCVAHDVVNVQGVLHSSSPLVDRTVHLETYDNYRQMEQVIGDRVELTFVPMRNSLFLTVAANRALEVNCRNLVTGVCQMDNANYPDCRASFIQAQQMAIQDALGIKDFFIHTPLMWLDKRETVLLARDLPGCWEALALSHTCYAGVYPACGECHACRLRAHGFEEAGLPDPRLERVA